MSTTINLPSYLEDEYGIWDTVSNKLVKNQNKGMRKKKKFQEISPNILLRTVECMAFSDFHLSSLDHRGTPSLSALLSAQDLTCKLVPHFLIRLQNCLVMVIRSGKLRRSCGDLLPDDPLSSCLGRWWFLISNRITCPLFDAEESKPRNNGLLWYKPFWRWLSSTLRRPVVRLQEVWLGQWICLHPEPSQPWCLP